MPSPSIGIDVQAARDCAWAVLDGEGELIDQGWVDGSPGALEDGLGRLCERHPGAVFGVDAPRMPLPAAREWYWRRGGWRARTPSERGAGRHCEVVVRAHSLANPQWTPLASDAPPWMEIGFRIFEELESRELRVHEVFPSASRSLLPESTEVRGTLRLAAFDPGPKDQLDAIVAAHTVFEFGAGRGCEVGGGDGLGTILLPRPLPDPIPAVLEWPAAPGGIG